MTDLQIACLVWSMQMYEYKKIEKLINLKFSNRVKFLNANQFLDRPKETLRPIAHYLGCYMTQNQIDTLEQQGLFSSHAKLKEKQYSTEIRQLEKNSIRKKYNSEFEEIHQWLEQFVKLPKLPSQSHHLDLY